MNYQHENIADAAKVLEARFTELESKADILKAVELKALFDELKTLDPAQRATFGKELNMLKQELQKRVKEFDEAEAVLPPLDVTAPFDINAPLPQLMSAEHGTVHPLMKELETVLDIFYRMGFTAVESREIDDDYHMFGALNFPEGHPARDDYDTFMTEQQDTQGTATDCASSHQYHAKPHPTDVSPPLGAGPADRRRHSRSGLSQ